jgi:hypothetical protein
VLAGIDWRAIGGKRGEEALVSDLGWLVLAQRNSAIFLFSIDLFNSNFQFEFILIKFIGT